MSSSRLIGYFCKEFIGDVRESVGCLLHVPEKNVLTSPDIEGQMISGNINQ